MSIKQIGKQIEHGIHQSSRTISLVSIVVLFGMMLVQTVDVIGRYAFDKPLKISYDMIEVMMALLVFWSLSYCASLNSHIRVDLIISRLSRQVSETLDRITFGASAFILALITWRLSSRAWTILQNPPGPVTLTLHIPYWPLLIAASLGCFLFCLEYLIRVFNPSSGIPETPVLKEKSSQISPAGNPGG